MLLVRFVDGIDDGLDGLVPADLLELALAALADAPERGLQAIAGVDVRDFVDAAQAYGAVRFVDEVAGLDKGHPLVADRAFQIAPGQAMELMAKMGHPFPCLGVGLGGREPVVGRDHAGGTCEAQGPCRCARRLQKAPAREPAVRAARS